MFSANLLRATQNFNWIGWWLCASERKTFSFVCSEWRPEGVKSLKLSFGLKWKNWGFKLWRLHNKIGVESRLDDSMKIKAMKKFLSCLGRCGQINFPTVYAICNFLPLCGDYSGDAIETGYETNVKRILKQFGFGSWPGIKLYHCWWECARKKRRILIKRKTIRVANDKLNVSLSGVLHSGYFYLLCGKN